MKKETEKTGDERREFPRLPKEVSVKIKKLEYPMTDDTVSAITRDLAETGARFATPELYQPGTMLNLEVELRGWQHHLQGITSIVDADTMSKPLSIIAEVMWSKECPEDNCYEVGVRFNDIYENDYKAFKTYMTNVTEKLKEQTG